VFVERDVEVLRVTDSPRLLVTAKRTGHDVEVTVERGLEEPAAAHLLNGDESAAEVLDAPQLGVVVLLRTRHYAEIQFSDLMRIEKTAAADLLDGAHTASHVVDPPVLGGVKALERSGNNLKVLLRYLVRVQEAQAAALQPDDPGIGVRSHRRFLVRDFG
jgi:hypothetical protein